MSTSTKFRPIFMTNEEIEARQAAELERAEQEAYEQVGYAEVTDNEWDREELEP